SSKPDHAAEPLSLYRFEASLSCGRRPGSRTSVPGRQTSGGVESLEGLADFRRELLLFVQPRCQPPGATRPAALPAGRQEASPQYARRHVAVVNREGDQQRRTGFFKVAVLETAFGQSAQDGQLLRQSRVVQEAESG